MHHIVTTAEPFFSPCRHQAGYGNKTLGLPKYTPTENIPLIDASLLKSYTKEFYQPERMVLAGVGIDHQQLVDLGQKYFSVPKNEAKDTNEASVPQNKAVWTGGTVMVRATSETTSLLSVLLIGLFVGRT